MKKTVIFIITGILLLSLFSGVFWYIGSREKKVVTEAPGVSDDEILIGSSSALGGYASFLGSQTVRGSLAYINEVNENGGVNGRKIRLIAYDDEYDPEKTVQNTQKLIGEDGVFALFDYVGTPTSVRIIDIVDVAEVPLLGLFTGAETLRSPIRPYIFNVRDSYYSETEAAISYFVDELGFSKIAVFYQNDAFGQTVLTGTKLALTRRGLDPVASATYERGSMDISGAAKTIRESEAQAVVMVGTYSPLAKFVKISNNEGFKPYFHTVSFVGSEAFASELIQSQGINESEYEKIIVTQVVPSPFSKEFSSVREYIDLSEKYYPGDEPNYVALEGFVNAKVLVEALRIAGTELTREGFVDALESMHDFDIGVGTKLGYGERDHQGLDGVYYSRLSKNGVFETFELGGGVDENF